MNAKKKQNQILFFKLIIYLIFFFQQPIVSSFSTSPSSYKPRTSNSSYQPGMSPSRASRSKSPLRSTSPVRRSVSPGLNRTTSPRLHNSSLSPTSKQVCTGYKRKAIKIHVDAKSRLVSFENTMRSLWQLCFDVIVKNIFVPNLLT